MMKNIFRLLSMMILSFPLLLTGCYNDNEEDLYPSKPSCDTSNVTYSVTIAKIMQTSCNTCHNSVTASGGVITDTYEGLKIPAQSGLLWDVVTWNSTYKMPKDAAKLSDCDLAKINIWINAGAPNN